MLAGALSWTLGLPISYLPPASWQVILGPDRLTKTGEGKKKQTQTKPRAAELAESFLERHHGGSLKSYTKKDAEGVADALGMGVWRVMALARDLGLFEEGSTTWCESAFSSFSWFRSLRDKPKRHRAKR
jgi:hypothetical protein